MQWVNRAFGAGLRLFIVAVFFASSWVNAETKRHQFQMTLGFGLLAGSKFVDQSFDIQVEPEFFITEHISASFRFDATLGGLDGIGLQGRGRYYFGLGKSGKLDLHVGLGAGGIINRNGPELLNITVPEVGLQYGLTEHIKVGAEASLEIISGGNQTALGVRLLPVQLKWAF